MPRAAGALAVLLLVLCASSASCKGGGNFGGVGGGGSSAKGGFGVTSSGGRYTSSFSKGSTGTAGTMTGGSWGAKGSARTSGGSRLYTIKGTHHSPGPRTYYGGHGFRGPRYYNGARATTLVAGASAVAVAAVWRKNSPARYDFYLASQACEREDFFRFGDTCRQCSRGVCPDGQYRVPCTGGSDAYCAKCDNVCYRFSDKSSEEISLGTCLEASIVDSSPPPEALELACDPNTDPFTCAYTSEGTPGKGISDCQIETCCKDCVNHEDAAAQGKGTVCVGSTGGLKKPDEKAYLYFLGEIPMNKKRFNGVSHSYKDALQSLTGAREVKIEGVEDFKLCKLPKKWLWDKTQTYCTLDETHEPNEGDEEWATIADFRVEISRAADIDMTWAKLTEDSVNQELQRLSLQPMIMYQTGEPSDSELWQMNNQGLIVGIAVGSILGVFLLPFLLAVLKTFWRESCRSSSSNSHTAVPTHESVWDTKAWSELDGFTRHHWTVLGWNQDNWEGGYPKARTEGCNWADLEPDELRSATALGWDEKSWDNNAYPVDNLSLVRSNDPEYAIPFT
eukprot:Tamp_12515.p1 GENE.Tamp_12515~~Tamp_12515.p1  ORF type:complete len:563 (+),score=59.71 Tamp_12515:32-1720(+)